MPPCLPHTLCYFVVFAGLHAMEKGDAKLCDEFSQASAGDMQGLELSRRTRLEFDGVFRMA
jgi:hypothetical protein